MKMKKMILTGAVLAATTLTTLTNVQADTTFKDVPTDHWSYKAIMDLKEKNIVAGYGNGIFGFGDSITRGQVARLLYVYLKPVDVDAKFQNPFTDIKGSMFEKEILAITKAGIMSGYGNGKFGPNEVLTREQLAAVLTQAFDLKGTTVTTFKDVDKNYWATKAISAVQESKIAAGTGSNLFEPKRVVTREQYAQFLYNGIKSVNKPETKPETKPGVTPIGIPNALVTDDFFFDRYSIEISPVREQSISKQGQNLVTEVNKKYNANLRYRYVASEIDLYTPNLPRIIDSHGSFSFVGKDADNFYFVFVVDKSTVELAKNWMHMINPNFTLDKEIDKLVNPNPEFKKEIDSFVKNNKDYINRFEKDNHSVEIAISPLHSISPGESVVTLNPDYSILHVSVQAK
ncbi:S-layer homology domain-containing protein [Bacillus sp. IBL03825]|uniref:S-layer homology domain-containing protein n=1 Tax=Bacillus sp. IBL03825 TaxID=2953580 RepID=UPI002156FE81|nr:S-layer homology domain-containing protein [Bacillus sp. IBL03825]MCR6850010.1 S-layer homology domain-containing protein [Bacillus sp. IBL03825]